MSVMEQHSNGRGTLEKELDELREKKRIFSTRAWGQW